MGRSCHSRADPNLEAYAGGRHDPHRRAARRRRAGGAGDRVDRDAAAAPRAWTAGPSGSPARGVRAVDAHGKNLFLRFDGDLTLHSHLRMGGSWGVYPRGERWHRAPRRAWLVIRTERARGRAVRRPRARADDRRAHAASTSGSPRSARTSSPTSFDEEAFLRRLREDDQTRGIGDALLDQRIIAGIGNIWKSEGCFIARRRPVAQGRRRLRRRGARDRARRPAADAASVEQGRPSPGSRSPAARRENRYWVYKRAGRPAARCETHRSARAGRATTTARPTGAPGASGDRAHHLAPLKRVGHKGADHVAPGNTLASFQAALDLRRRHDRVRRAARCATAASCSRTTTRTPPSATPPTLEEGLDHFAERGLRGVELDVDLKLPGYEREVVDGLARARADDRALISSHYLESARADRRARARAPPRLVGAARRAATTRAVVARARRATRCSRWRRAPARPGGARASRAGGCEALMSHCLLVTPAARARRCTSAGGQLYVWTVDDAREDRRARGDRRRRRDHQRPAAVRLGATARSRSGRPRSPRGPRRGCGDPPP